MRRTRNADAPSPGLFKYFLYTYKSLKSSDFTREITIFSHLGALIFEGNWRALKKRHECSLFESTLYLDVNETKV